MRASDHIPCCCCFCWQAILLNVGCAIKSRERESDRLPVLQQPTWGFGGLRQCEVMLLLPSEKVLHQRWLFV